MLHHRLLWKRYFRAHVRFRPDVWCSLPSDLMSACPELCTALLPACPSPDSSCGLGQPRPPSQGKLPLHHSFRLSPTPQPHSQPRWNPPVSGTHCLDCPLWTLVMTLLFFSPTLQPHGLPTRLFCPWNSPGKKYCSGLHFLLQGGGGAVSSWPRDWTHVSCIGHRVLYGWVTNFTFNFFLTISGLHITFSTWVLCCQHSTMYLPGMWLKLH